MIFSNNFVLYYLRFKRGLIIICSDAETPSLVITDLHTLIFIRGGQHLLEKSRNNIPLTNPDRNLLAQYIVEHVVLGNSVYCRNIGQEVWEHWAREVARLFRHELVGYWFEGKSGESTYSLLSTIYIILFLHYLHYFTLRVFTISCYRVM